MAIKLGALDNFVGFNLRMAQDTSFRIFARHTGERDLKPGRFAAMMVIHHNPGLTQIELSRAIARDKSSVTPLIQELARDGLVTRRPSNEDRRSIKLKLTKAGESTLSVLLGHAADHDRKLDVIVGGRKAELIALLKKIAVELS
jgi:DNA-binding MarR family transcriptional regulator